MLEKIKNKIKESMYLTCDTCGKKDQDVCFRLDPYHWEIDEKKVTRIMCQDCHDERAEEI